MPTIAGLRALHRRGQLNALVDGIWYIALGAAGGAIVELLGVTVGDVLRALGVGFDILREWLLAPGRDGVLHIHKVMGAVNDGMDFLSKALDIWGLWETMREKMREAREARARRRRRR